MSRRYPTIEQFEGHPDKITVEEVRNNEIVRRDSVEGASKELLLKYQEVMTDGILSLTDEMRDRYFYYYDDKHLSNRWIRIFELLILDIAVVVDMFYMYDISNPIISFPNEMQFYNHYGEDYHLTNFIFQPKPLEENMTEEDEVQDIIDKIDFGNSNILRIVDGMVYAL